MVKHTLALLVAAASLTGCDVTAYDACALCSVNQRCFESCDDDALGDPSCEPRPRGCVERCDTASLACGEGHPCVSYGTDQVCSFECVSEACGSRRECRGADCQDVECGKIVSCLDTSKICDEYAYRCYSFDGRCTAQTDCPFYDEYWVGVANVSCTNGYCQISAKPPGPPPGLVTPTLVEVLAPTVGQVLASDADLQIVWRSTAEANDTSALVVILDGVPTSKRDLAKQAVWGAARAPGSTNELRVTDGHLIVDGVWTERVTGLPHGRPLSLVVQIVRQGELRAISNVIPFSIDRAWPQRGDTCDLTDPYASCMNPSESLACNPTTGTCERVCGSYRDCTDIAPPRDCGVPRGNARYCE